MLRISSSTDLPTSIIKIVIDYDGVDGNGEHNGSCNKKSAF